MKNFTGLTFTGLDERTDLRELARANQAWPAIEWGILASKSQMGKNQRYPSLECIQEIIKFSKEMCIRLALHINGKWCRDFLNGDPTIFQDCPGFGDAGFERIQLNFHDEKMCYDAELCYDMVRTIPEMRGLLQIITQLDSTNPKVSIDLIETFTRGGSLYSIVPLFDKSGGAGIVPDLWPPAMTWKNGYAGGLGPHNIREEFWKIEEAAGGTAFWIDMETHIRTDEWLDLGKCQEVVEIVRDIQLERKEAP